MISERILLNSLNKERKDNILKFWTRFEKFPSFKGLKVLEIGCGSGALCLDVALKGAKKVIGLDINKKIIEFAKKIIFQNHPKLKNTINFLNCEIFDLLEDNFDIILSKDTFEHILNLELTFAEMKKKLKKGGLIYTGIGPLYNSFYGDHKLTKSILPWGHVILPDAVLIRRINKANRKKNLKLIKKIQDLGLNKLSFAEYKKIIYNSGLQVKYFRINYGNPLLRIFSLFRCIPFLEEYFTYNIYCILRKK